MADQTDSHTSLKIWDAPVRITHWLLAGAFFFSWWTAENAEMDWHRLSGYTILGLVVFRIYWGFMGSQTARFSNFLRGPGTVARYFLSLRGMPRHISAGHNPMGGWSIAAMLILLLTQITLGLFAIDVDAFESGPLNYLVSFETGRWAAEWHEQVFSLLLILVALHVVAILYYALMRRENLVSAMLTGHKRVNAGTQPLSFTPFWRAIPGIVLAFAVAYAVSKGLRFE